MNCTCGTQLPNPTPVNCPNCGAAIVSLAPVVLTPPNLVHHWSLAGQGCGGQTTQQNQQTTTIRSGWPMWALVIVLVFVGLATAAGITLGIIAMARSATTSELANATGRLVAEAAITRSVVADEGAATRTAIATSEGNLKVDGVATRTAVFEDGAATRAVVATKSDELKAAIAADGAVTRNLVIQDGRRIARIVRGSAPAPVNLSGFATKDDLSSLRAAPIDLSGVATKVDLKATEDRLLAKKIRVRMDD